MISHKAFGQSSRLLSSGSRRIVGSQLTLVIGPQANNSAAALANGVDFIDEHDRPELICERARISPALASPPRPLAFRQTPSRWFRKSTSPRRRWLWRATSCRCQVSHPLYPAPNIHVDPIKTYPTNTARMVVQLRTLTEAERSFTCFSLSLARLAPMATATEHF